MGLSHNTYSSKDEMIEDIKKSVLLDFKESDYTESDKFQVSLHRVIDNFVSYVSIADTNIYLSWFSVTDEQTLDSGMLPDRLKEGKDKFNDALLYCLIEQELYNIEELNKLQ